MSDALTLVVRALDAAPEAQAVHVSGRVYFELLKSASSSRYGGPIGGDLYVMGRRVVRERPAWTCRNCGAPAEPHHCSYCLSPSEFVEVRSPAFHSWVFLEDQVR